MVGNTREEAEEWAKENVSHPYVATSRYETAHLEGTLYAPEVKSVTHELYEQLRQLEALSGVNKNIMVEC